MNMIVDILRFHYYDKIIILVKVMIKTPGGIIHENEVSRHRLQISDFIVTANCQLFGGRVSKRGVV